MSTILPEVSIIIPTLNRDYTNLLISLWEDRYYWMREIIIQKDALGEGCPKTFNKWVARAKYDWICFLWDDVIVEPYWLEFAFKEQQATWKRLIWLNDNPVNPDNDCTHFLIHKSLVELLEDKQIFHEDFSHMFCDSWLGFQVKNLNEHHFARSSVITHNHYTKWHEVDACYTQWSKHFNRDKQKWEDKMKNYNLTHNLW